MRDTLTRQVLGRLDHNKTPQTKWPDSKGEYWALCPYHDDTNPENFSVSERGFKCFACGKQGSVKVLAQHLGIEAPTTARGCTLDQYGQAKHLPTGFLKNLGITEHQERGHSVLHMPYKDTEGQLLATRKRLSLSKQGKRQRFLWRKGSKVNLYGLWLLADMRKHGWILLVEGESDCHTAWLYDLPALGVPGASNWRTDWTEHLKGLDVYVWHEPDQGGDTFVQSLAKDLPQARVILPPEGVKDLSEAHIQGQVLKDLLEQLKARATPIQETQNQSATSEPEHFTDVGNAKRLVHQYRQDVRYCASLGWLVWDGKRWKRDEQGQIYEYAKETVKGLYLEAQQQNNEDLRLKTAQHARASEACSRIKAMVELAKTDQRIAKTAESFDCDPLLLNVKNGTLDLRTRNLREHKQSDNITKLAPVDYDPQATDPTLENYLETATDGNQELKQYLQRMVGYTLTGSTSEECLFLLLGPAATGKSTLVEALLAMLGDYGQKASFETFLESRSGNGATPEIARMRGARLVSAVEAPSGKGLDAAKVKELTGGDTVQARYLYKEPFEFKPQCKIWLATNDCPKVDDRDTGMWRRLKRIPFEHELARSERDPRVKEHLCEKALPALLAWAVKGCLAWQRERLGSCTIVDAKTSELRASFDPLGQFFAEECVFGLHSQVEAQELRECYEEWADSKGARPISDRNWGSRLEDRGCVRQRTRNDRRRVTVWHGIGLSA